MLHNAYTIAINKAVDSQRKGDIQSAKSYISEAMTLSMDTPEPHNLLGILSEMKGDDNTARRHYRAAYALDPTYKPSCRNLERLVKFEWVPIQRNYDYGNELKIANAKPDTQQNIKF